MSDEWGTRGVGGGQSAAGSGEGAHAEARRGGRRTTKAQRHQGQKRRRQKTKSSGRWRAGNGVRTTGAVVFFGQDTADRNVGCPGDIADIDEAEVNVVACRDATNRSSRLRRHGLPRLEPWERPHENFPRRRERDLTNSRFAAPVGQEQNQLISDVPVSRPFPDSTHSFVRHRKQTRTPAPAHLPSMPQKPDAARPASYNAVVKCPCVHHYPLVRCKGLRYQGQG
jgi:hypothetical protein